MELSWQEYWSGLPFPPPGDLPNPGAEPVSLAPPVLADGFFTTVPPGKPLGDWINCGTSKQWNITQCLKIKKELLSHEKTWRKLMSILLTEEANLKPLQTA